MKCSFSSIAWSKEDTDDVIEILIRNRIRHIDLIPSQIVTPLESLEVNQIANFKKTWFTKGFSAIGMQSLFYERKDLKFFQSEESVKDSIAHFRRIANLANQLEITSLVLGSPQQRKIDSKKDSNDLVLFFFKQLSSICVENKLTLCLEPNSSHYDTNFLTTTAETAKFIERLSLPAIMMNFDTGCEIMNQGDPIESFSRYNDIIGHVHISAPYLKPVTAACIDHTKFSNLLRKKMYNKCIAIEMLNLEKRMQLFNIQVASKILKDYYMSELL
jgi:D-psicose/D-tagatose/L-ribulose 3-epimerase